MSEAEQKLPESIDRTTPNIARMYDYALGGKDNFAADRKVAEGIWELHSAGPRPAQENRAFLRRVVRYLAEAGIRQFLDLGSGLPTQGNVHEVAREIAPESRVVYVDYDPAAVNHARALLAGSGGVAVVHQDVRRPVDILGHPKVTELLDFDQPVAVLMLAILHVVADEDDPIGLVNRYRAPLVPGSYLAISHLTSTDQPSESLGGIKELFKEQKVREPIAYRGKDEILRFFDGLELLDPGLVTAPQWRPHIVDPAIPDTRTTMVGLGRVPG